MSRAVRLSGVVATQRFAWQMAAGQDAPDDQPVPLFAPSSRPSDASSSPRELHLPSVEAERAAAVEHAAFAKGYADGERAAEAAVTARVEAEVARLAESVAAIRALREGMMKRAEDDLVRLAIAIAERLVRREVAIDPTLLLVLARVATGRLGEQAVATVHLHPADHRAVTAGQKRSGSLEVLADPEVPRGGCVVRSNMGVIDMGIAAQVRELSRELLDETSEDDRANVDLLLAND